MWRARLKSLLPSPPPPSPPPLSSSHTSTSISTSTSTSRPRLYLKDINATARLIRLFACTSFCLVVVIASLSCLHASSSSVDKHPVIQSPRASSRRTRPTYRLVVSGCGFPFVWLCVRARVLLLLASTYPVYLRSRAYLLPMYDCSRLCARYYNPGVGEEVAPLKRRRV